MDRIHLGITNTQVDFQNKKLEVFFRKGFDFESAINISFKELNAQFEELDKQALDYFYCSLGYRSAVVASILKQQVLESVVNIKIGYQALSQLSLACSRT